jgi:hypothetical protein
MVKVAGMERLVGLDELTVEERVTEPGLSEQVTPVGDPTTLQARVTVPEKVLVGVTKTVVVALEPGVTATSEVAEVRAKSDSGLLSAVVNV